MQYKNIKILISLFVVLFLIISMLSGCSSTSSSGELTSENVTVNEYVEGDEIPIKKIDKKLWEKEYSQLKTQDVTIDKDWNKYICINSLFISAKKFTDISELTNQFINDDDTGRISKYYNAVGVENILTSIGTADAEYAQSHLQLNNILTNNHNAYITGVTMRSIVNQNEGGLDNLLKQKSAGGKISLGNTRDEVVKVIGDGERLTSVEQDDITIINYRYADDNVTMELQFIKTAKMEESEAVLTQIKWTPQLIKKAMKQFLY